jgi:ParB-like chromosome segregation protein Spo0J
MAKPAAKKKPAPKKEAVSATKGKGSTAELVDLRTEPVSTVQWVDRKNLKPNNYNPNKVAPPEMELLKISILEDGWTQPIVVLSDMTIVDGFHRYTVSDDKRLRAKYAGFVPIVVIKADPVHRQMSTIRHNRARGTHAVLSMADIVKGMVDDGVDPKEIQRRMQMEDEEIARLVDRAGMPKKVGKGKGKEGFGKAFVPNVKAKEGLK